MEICFSERFVVTCIYISVIPKQSMDESYYVFCYYYVIRITMPKRTMHNNAFFVLYSFCSSFITFETSRYNSLCNTYLLNYQEPSIRAFMSRQNTSVPKAMTLILQNYAKKSYMTNFFSVFRDFFTRGSRLFGYAVFYSSVSLTKVQKKRLCQFL